MSDNYEAALKGTRKEAESALEQIQKQIIRYGKCGESASRYQLKFCLNTFRSICVVAATPKGIHYDLYWDIFIRILSLYIEPNASPSHWARLLECLRYFHYLMIDKKLFGEASKVFNYVAGRPNKLQNETDYKVILSVYSQHLHTQRQHLQYNENNARKEIKNVMTALNELFTAMLVHNSKDNFIYPELSADFVQCLMPKRTVGIFEFLSALPTNKTQMYDIFFILLAQMKMPQPPAEDLEVYWQRQLEALWSFLQFDIADKLQHKLALHHLRACRNQRVIQADKAIGHIVTLLYNYVKVLYSGTTISGSLGNTFVELCGKLTSFFEKSGEALITQHKWFMDVLVFLNLLLCQTHQHHSSFFHVFWRQINSIECYAAYFELMLCCIKLAPHITESKLTQWTCCTSVRKHTITGFVIAALSAYDTFLQNIQVLEKHDIAVSELNKTFTMIMRHGVRIIDSMICITPTSSDLKMFYALFANLTRNVRTSAHALFCCKVAEVLTKIQNKFARTDWTLLVRRLYKTAAISDDKSLAVDLQVCYIASILAESPQAIDVNTLRNQIGIFYASHGATLTKCLLEWNEQSKSVFRPLLDPGEKRLLHWLEAHQFGKYYKTNVALQASLMRCSLTLYDKVLIARVGKLSIDAAAALESICKKLSCKSRDSVGVTRLDQLVLAHARTALMLDSYAVHKNTVAFETKECQEDSLDELLTRKEFGSICLTKELKWVAMAQEAVNAFEDFYSRFDLEHISSDDACIDWEVILDDVAMLASFLHLSGYMEYATAAWLLYYRIANTIDDQNNALRALAYFCEQAEYFENDSRLNLQEEINKNQPHILNTLENLVTHLKRNQNYALLCLCYMSYFYARSGNLSYAQMLLQLVEQKHQELVEREGKYDLVLGTMQTVKFRILWKHLGNESVAESGNETELMQSCLLREVDMTLERFRDFVFIATGDTISYTILILSLIQQIAECTANRMCDNFVNGFFAAALKMALSSGLALRLVQILSMWMLTNLQMEHMKKAQTKLKLIEFVMGTHSLQQLQESSEGAMALKKPTMKYTEPAVEILTFNPGMETMRKVTQVHLSPVNMEKLRLGSTVRNCALKRFLQYDNNDMLQDNEVLQWNYFTVGCLNARLYFLADDFEQLDGFYEDCAKWFEQSENKYLLTNFQNIQLLCMQHYANYLRAQKNYEKAIKCIENALSNCVKMKFNVDSLYRINLILQLRATKIEMSRKKVLNRQSQSLRRALEFDVSPPDDRCEKPKSKKVEDNLLLEAANVEKLCSKNTAFIIYNSEKDAQVASVRKPELKLAKMSRRKLEKSSSSSSDSSGCNTSPDINYKDDLNVCQIIDNSSSTDDEQATVVERKYAKNKMKQPASVGNIMIANCKQRPAAQLEQLKSQRNKRDVRTGPQEHKSNDANEIRIKKTVITTVTKTLIVKSKHVNSCDAIEIMDNSDDSDVEIVKGLAKLATATTKDVNTDIIKQMENIEKTKTTKVKTTNTKILKPHARAKQVLIKDPGSGVHSSPKTYLARTRGRLRKVDSTENNENIEPAANAPTASAAMNNVGRRRRQKT